MGEWVGIYDLPIWKCELTGFSKNLRMWTKLLFHGLPPTYFSDQFKWVAKIWFANLKMWLSKNVHCTNVDQIDFPRFANNLFLQSPGVSAAGPLKRTICINAYLPYTWITSVWLNQNWGLQTQVRAKKLTTLHNCFWKSKSASYDKASANTAC